MREAASILAALGKDACGAVGERELTVAAGELVAVMSRLKALGGFILLDIDAVDRPEAYELAYRLLDRGGSGAVGLFTIRVRAEKSGAEKSGAEKSGAEKSGAAKSDAAEPCLPSIIGVWKAADVLEREVWDLMGVRFEGRGEMRRILCKDDFEGHPLRKDFIVPVKPRFADGAKP